MAIHGVLLVDKPIGITSFDVLRALRKTLRTKSLGHAGTLDPFASGLLVVCAGDYTRFAGYLTDDDKTYEATVKFGERTNTDDCDGEVLETHPLPADWREQVVKVLDAFRGPISQVPPAFSAIHVDGKRAYELARAGKEVVLEAREITVHRLDIVEFLEDGVRLVVEASKGTYIRSLARDIGAMIGCGAHLVALRRTQSGAFSLAQAHTLDALKDFPGGAQNALLEGAAALAGIRPLVISEGARQKMRFGQLEVMEEGMEEGLYALYDAAESLIGLGDVIRGDDDPEARFLKTRRLLPQ